MPLPLSTKDALCCLRRQVSDLRSLRDVVPYQTGTAWPTSADIPEGTGAIWWNSTASAARTYINVGGSLHYVAFDT